MLLQNIFCIHVFGLTWFGAACLICSICLLMFKLFGCINYNIYVKWYSEPCIVLVLIYEEIYEKLVKSFVINLFETHHQNIAFSKFVNHLLKHAL